MQERPSSTAGRCIMSLRPIYARVRHLFRHLITNQGLKNVVLSKEFWDYGHQLFKSTPETFPAAFVTGDIFDPAVLAPRGGAFLSASDIASVLAHESNTPGLSALTSLTPLHGKISAIHASSFFHLFSEERQLALAHLLASLLRPESGSVIFGRHVARPVKGFFVEALSPAALEELKANGKPLEEFSMFCHSPESWRKLWVEEVFGGTDEKGEERVKVHAEQSLVERKGDEVDPDVKVWIMTWFVTLL